MQSMSATEQAKAIREGRLTASALMEETLARVDEVNPQVNALVSLRPPEDVMAEAKAADQAPQKGPLHGLPIAIKDLARAKGVATSKGSPVFAGDVAEADDLYVGRLRAAGAIVIGKSNVPEFGLGSHTMNPVFGATGNPYAPHLSCGGSSGGAAVALATGMLSIADGSDMMGSLRNPAGWNNVYGMRPSWGLVPNEPEGDMYLHQLSTNGPMARSPVDLALLLDVMAGPDARVPYRANPPSAVSALGEGAKTARIGWLGDWGTLPFEDGIIPLAEAALGQFGDLGCAVETLAPKLSFDLLWEAWTGLRAFSVASSLGPLYDDPNTRSLLKDTAQWEVRNGQAMSAAALDGFSRGRSDWFRAAMQMFEQVDVLAWPTAQVWPFPLEQAYPTRIGTVEMDTYHRWMCCMIPASLIGLPAVAVPIGFGGPNDLPMGLQLIGAPGRDADLLRVAQLWHEATDWPAARRP